MYLVLYGTCNQELRKVERAVHTIIKLRVLCALESRACRGYYEHYTLLK
jgi:hypothetical protein